jgi:hypothetical protein
MIYWTNGLKTLIVKVIRLVRLVFEKDWDLKLLWIMFINNYIHVGVDPYGNLEYQHYDDTGSYTCDYTDEMRDTMLKDFLPYRNEGKFTLCNMTDTQFMNATEHKDSKFAFVHFDGPHMTRDVITEAVWFANRSAPHTRFVLMIMVNMQ